MRAKDESKAAKRRQMRLQRRQLRRRAGRQRDLFELLQRNGLLPAYPRPVVAQRPHLGNISRSQLRHEILEKLDEELRAKWEPAMAQANPQGAVHVLPYFLRARALDEQLEPFELGRALYHLGQRRGFLSNRREKSKSPEEEKEKGKVYEGIGALEQDISKTGARTLGEYFSRIDPTEQRIRQRYTHRSMFQQEFESIWKAQAEHHPQVLSTQLKKEMHQLLFRQRPIAAQSHLIGECELEPGRKRAPLACLAAQRFRLLQKVNDLRICTPDEFKGRTLEAQERAKLVEALEIEGDQTFASIRKLLKLPNRGVWFNLERGGEKKIPGNRTRSRMVATFRDRWKQFSEAEKEEIVEAWRTAENEEWLARQGFKRWALTEEEARLWASEKNGPEDGYSRLSRKALGKLLPLMETGLPFKEAEKQIYGVSFSGGKVWEVLPPVREALPSLRNPAVERAMTELRKVVNAIVRESGKPEAIRIELARELKNPREARERIWKAMRARQDLREKKKEELVREVKDIGKPSRNDVERMLLWEECSGVCPYTGRSIKLRDLFGDHPQFDVEHILPLRLCPDNSFANKTLCYIEENRLVKRGRTPWQAYGENPERWEEVLNRVRRFKRLAGPSSARPPRSRKGKGGENGAGMSGKLRRFLVKSDEDLAEFSNRQLQDTRYTSKLAGRYLGLLYGGRDWRHEDGANSQRVFNTPGALTADLRWHWCLEAILREAEAAASEEKRAKPRGDHRHHAIDAIVVALTTPAAVKAMSDAAERNAQRGRTSIKGIEAPWPDFVESIRPHIASLVVSHRPEHKLSGPLHDETLYGNSHEREGKAWVHVRKAVDSLTAGDIGNIVDPRAREAVQKRLKELGSLKALQTAGVDPPYLETNDGRRIPIRRVRVRKALTTTQVGAGIRARSVAPNNNHHMEIVAELDAKGNESRWDGVPVSLLEAHERRRKGLPVVQRDHGSGLRFKFSLMGGDTIELQKGERGGLYVIRTIATNGQISLARIHDGRLKKEMQDAGDWWSPKPEGLREFETRKVLVDVLGKVHPAND
ncbi:MAG: type II CRISPR RNA-guided endonuclease Cas9 [Candidatus Acidiferrales bacterium]